jgi:hypothetical protein
MALIDNFMFTPEKRVMSNNSIKEEQGNNPNAKLNALSDASMNVGANLRYNSDRLDSNRSTEGLSAFLEGGVTGLANGNVESFNPFDKVFPESRRVGAGISLPIGRGNVEVSSGIRELPAYGESTSNSNITYNGRDGDYVGGYADGKGYKGIYGGLPIGTNSSINGSVNADGNNSIISALLQFTHNY